MGMKPVEATPQPIEIIFLNELSVRNLVMLLNGELTVMRRQDTGEWSRELPDAGKRILVRKGREFMVIRYEDVAYFFIENGVSYLVDARNQSKYIMAQPLRNIELTVNPKYFFRATKKYLVNINAVVKLRPMKKGKLEVQLHPDPKESVIISQLKAGMFKRWLMEN
jgi:DNA-binding LytR/AlgR family response regulator